MKKLFAMVMAVAAISFVSCGNKTEKAECEDTCACACDTCVCDPCDCAAQACQKECGECPVKALAEKLEAGDAEAVGTALTEAQTKIEALVAEGKKNSNTQDELLDAQAAAAMLHITPRCLYNWTKKRLLPYVQIGRRRLYSKKVLQGLIDRNTLNRK